MARCFSCRIMRRRVFSSSGTLSSMASAAVLGRGEYLKLNSESYSTSSSRSSVRLEIRLGLAGEADDDVGGDGDVAPRVLHPLDAAHVLVARVEPLHSLEHARRSGLHRQMHVIAQRRILVDGVDDLLHEIARMRGGEAHAADARNLGPRGRAAWRNPSRPATDRDSCSRSGPRSWTSV